MNFGRKNKIPETKDLSEEANALANTLYEKTKIYETLQKILNPSEFERQQIIKLKDEISLETDILLKMQNQIKNKTISLDLPKNESVEDYEKNMDKITESTWTKKDTDIITQYEHDEELVLKPKSELSSIKPIDTKINQTIKTDLVVLGLRLAVGITFIVHGAMKLNSIYNPIIGGGEFVNMLASFSIPIELAVPIALAELLSGIFLSVGFLSRISSVMIGIIMLGAIFVIKGAQIFVGPNGTELDIIILMCTSLLATFGPGRISVSNISIKGMIFTRFLH